MIGALVFLFRINVGLVVLAATWFVFDNINDPKQGNNCGRQSAFCTHLYLLSREDYSILD
jgi:hypothetical protein